MDKKAIARRSDALNADGVRYHRRDLCDMIAYREYDIEQLKEENAKLREELESVGTAAYLYGRSDLKANNAKLLKLVRWMYERMDESCAVHYPYAPEPISYRNLMRAEELMREAGIEAKDG